MKKIVKKVVKKVVKKSKKNLKEFNIVAHIVPIKGNKNKAFVWGEAQYSLIALYLNRYGIEIGCICREVNTDEIRNMDPFLHEEFIENGGVFY